MGDFLRKSLFSNFSNAFQTFLSEAIFPEKFEKFDFQTFQTFFDQKVWKSNFFKILNFFAKKFDFQTFNFLSEFF